MKQKLMLGMETIAFQSGLFFKELTIGCQDIMDFLVGKKVDQDELATKFQRLANIIKDHTGLSPRIEANEWGPAVLVPDLLKNHVLRELSVRGYMSGGESLSAIASKGGPLKGTVNLMESRVTGFFAEIGFPIYMPHWIFQKESKFTASEIAATMVHEVGHVFTFMEYLSRGVTTNVVLNILSRKWIDADVKEREIILINASQALKLKQGEIDIPELAQTNKFEIVEAVIVTSVLDQTRSELGGSEYEIVNFEYLSDEFATRHGAGRDIVTALDKLHRMGGASGLSYRSMPVYIGAELLKLLLLCTPATFMFGAILIAGDHEYSIDVYDKAPDRFRRVRNQLVERIKLKNIPKEQQEQLLQDIAVIDDIVEKLNDRRQLFTLVLEKVFTFTKVSKRRKQLELQRELEALAFNNLFIKSAELDSL